MAWGVFYRPAEHQWHSPTVIHPTPRFKLPLSRAVLNDPAFSPDPRSHPHFSLANARSYKTPPSKSPSTVPHPLPTTIPVLAHPPMAPSGPPFSSPSPPSSDSDSLASFAASTSPTVSSATSPSQSSTQTHGSPVSSSVSLPSLSPSYPAAPPSTQHKVIRKPPTQRPFPLPAPEIPPKLDSANTLARGGVGPVASQNGNVPRKGRMKALVRRFTSRHNLDRIDELDETGPFGSSYHHDGPYEAIGSNLAQSTLPHISSDTTPHRSNVCRSMREFDRHRIRPGQCQASSTRGETGLSLHLEPGQILQQNTIYSSHTSSIASVPSQFRRQSDTAAIVTRPDHSRSRSLPNPRMRSLEDSSLDLLNDFQNRPSSLRAPREHYFGDNTPDILNTLPLHHDRDAAPYVPHQTEKTVVPPPRYESRLHGSGPPRSLQRVSPPSFNATSQKKHLTDSAAPVLPPHDPRHESAHSLDRSYTVNTTTIHSSASIPAKPLEPPRARHLPKRLVMPAPLQPQPPQLHHHPPIEYAAWQDEYPDEHALEGAHFEAQPAMYTRDPRLLRKKSTAFPAKTPIPDHAPISQDGAIPIMGNPLTKTTNGAEGTKERTRRRKLSKRKNDI